MRALAVLAVLVLGPLLAAPLARAASGPCADATACAAGQVCRVVGAGAGVCTWEAIDGQTLIDALVAAHADAARDVIFIGDLDAEGGPVGAEIHLDVPVGEDAVFGPRALPKIASAITIEGLGAGISTIDIDADMRLFLLEVDPVTNRRPDLLLKNLTLRDARPGPDAPGAGAVTVRATPTVAVAPALPELPILVADDVEFVSGSGPDAGAIANDGAPLRLDGCTFLQNEGAAGAVSSSTGAVILSSVFGDNRGGLAAAIAVPNATRIDEAGATVDNVLQISACTFEDNHGEGGAVLSLAASATISNSTFLRNVANQGKGGAVLARNLRLQAGLYQGNFAQGGGGAIAILDEPASGPIQIGGAVFRSNASNGKGGGVLHTGASLVVDQSFFEENTAGGGGGLSVEALSERNGALPDVQITATSFRGNVARADVSLAAGADTTIDERGADGGALLLVATGAGSAVLASGPGAVELEGSCIFGNGAFAVAVLGASIAATGNWWGADTGPATSAAPGGGDGDLVGAGVTTTGFLAEPASPCAADGVIGYPQLFIPARLAGTATVVADFRLLDLVRGLQVLQSDVGVVVPDTRLGLLAITVEGVNDDAVEGGEAFTFSIDPCIGDGCGYTTSLGNPTATVTITDNGDGSEGEGEGEGEDCPESLSVSSTSLIFAPPDEATGTSSATLAVKNDSPCDIQLLRPFVQAGASQGFAVQPLLLSALALAPGQSVDVVVVYTPPLEATGDEPVGSMRIESTGGSLVEVGLALAPGCACTASPGGGGPGPPAGAALGFLALALLGRRRRTVGLPKHAWIP